MTGFYDIEDKRAETRALQKMLRTLASSDKRIPMIFIDGIYGKETEEAVLAFQKEYGLEADGKMNFETNRKLNAEYVRVLRKREKFIGSPDFENMADNAMVAGDVFDSVYSLQILLRTLGVYDDRFRVALTGIFDSETEKAVNFFEELLERKPTGKVDRELWNKITLYSEIPFYN